MTDNDIIKALGFCFAVGDCEHCAYADKPCQELMGDALDLINRQKAEIERLKAMSRRQKITTIPCRSRVFSMKKIAEAKAEAIKEFAKKLKVEAIAEFDDDNCFDGFSVAVEDIDNLVKEMTEGEDESDIEM